MEANSSPQASRFRPRLSLLSALLLMTIAGVTIVLVQLWREVGPLRAELVQLRNEVGRLSVEDPNKPYAIEVRTVDDYTWKWRVWIPEGRAYRLQYASQEIPAKGFPGSNGMIVLDQPGEIWIQYRIAPNPNSDHWSDELSTPSGSIGSSSQPWVKWSRKMSTTEGVGHSTREYEPGEKILLARHLVSNKRTSSNKIEDPSAGFMIWLEPTK